MNPPADPIAVALEAAGALEALGIRYTIGGSIASSIAGEPRSTVDIDIVAALEETHARPLAALLSASFYVDEYALLRAIRARGIVNVVHQPTQLKVDFHVAGGTLLDEQQLLRRQKVEVSGGRVLHVHPPEDILLQKLRWIVAEASRIGSGATFSASSGSRARVSTAFTWPRTPRRSASPTCSGSRSRRAATECRRAPAPLVSGASFSGS